MKYGGKTVNGRSATKVLVERGEMSMELTVEAIPLGFSQLRDLLFPQVPQPMRYVEDERGGIMSNPDTGEHLLEPTERGERAEQFRLIERRRMAFALWHSLRNSPELEFDGVSGVGEWLSEQGGALGLVKPDAIEDARRRAADLADRVYADFQAAGFAGGDLHVLQQAIMQAGSISTRLVEEERKGFSRRDRPAVGVGDSQS